MPKGPGNFWGAEDPDPYHILGEVLHFPRLVIILILQQQRDFLTVQMSQQQQQQKAEVSASDVV